MKVVMLSQDADICMDGSAVQMRMRSYGALFESFTVLVFGTGGERSVELAPNARAIYIGGRNKIDGLLKGYIRLSRETLAIYPDVISSQDPFFLGAAALTVSRSRKIPLQIQIHTDCFSRAYAFSSPRHFLETVVAFFVVQGASCIRVVSERIAERVRPLTRASVSVLPIMVPDVPSSSARPAAFRGRFTLLTVSRLTAEKQVQYLLGAMQYLPEADLIVVGDGPLRKKLQEKAAHLGLASRVTFTGRRDPHAYYANADAYVQASSYEGYGMSLMEAALHGLPVITTDVGLVGETLKDGESALVVEPAAAAIAAAAGRLFREPSLRESLGNMARKNASASLVSESWYLKRYREALATCLSESPVIAS